MKTRDFIIGDVDNPQLKLTIIDLVERWKRRYPQEWDVFDRGMREIRKSQFKDSAISFDGNLQYAMRIPKKILAQIDFVTKGNGAGVTLEKDDKLWSWFKKEFPEFMVPVKR